MLKVPPADGRELITKHIVCDLVVVGGGLAGTCTAITAARQGLKVTLIQDRPVLGGNGSSEVRLWTLGATAHMANNCRWAREGGVINEILVENMHRNPEGNAILFDTVLLELVTNEPNITLLLNTSAFAVEKRDAETIDLVRAFCAQNSTLYEVKAPLFCDSSGDGIVGFLAGAAFRMGAESRDEFGEKFAPAKEYGELLGHSIYFYSKDVGRPVKFTPPAFALRDIEGTIPRFRNFNSKIHGCRLWWIEYGGRLDTVHETETIKWELWKVVYGVWNYIKNSGKFPDAENLTLEWVGHIPGKRESRRFEGDLILTQQDVIENRPHDDVVSFGGWAIDLHPADGVFSEYPGCVQWQQKSVYGIPYRTMYSRNIRNLFLAGRIISVSHVAFGSTRVMATCAHGGQAVAVAAAICREKDKLPRDLSTGPLLRELQTRLVRIGQYIPNRRFPDPIDLAARSKITASSTYRLARLEPNAETQSLENSGWGMLLPVAPGKMPAVTFTLDIAQPTTLIAELRTCSRVDGHTPDVTLATKEIQCRPGESQPITLDFPVTIDQPRYVFVTLQKNPAVRVHLSDQRLTGVLSVHHRNDQRPHADIGVDSFEFWVPQRRPGGKNFALQVDPPIQLFEPSNLTNGLTRPIAGPNAWLAALDDPKPTVTLSWDTPQTISRIDLTFDCDWDHPMESNLWGHPESDMPFCVRRYRILADDGQVITERENHQTRNEIRLPQPLRITRLTVELLESHGDVPKALFEIRCFSQ